MDAVDILLVEDNITDAELAIRELQKNNLVSKLIHLRNGQEALEFIFATGKYEGKRDIQHLPKVIMLDIQMPKVNGIEVLKKIKSDPRTRSLPVVILTSSDELPDIDSCYGLGANSYIVKPVNFDGFSNVIKKIGLYWLHINHTPQ